MASPKTALPVCRWVMDTSKLKALLHSSHKVNQANLILPIFKPLKPALCLCVRFLSSLQSDFESCFSVQSNTSVHPVTCLFVSRPLGDTDFTVSFRAYARVLTGIHAEGEKATCIRPRPRRYTQTHTYTHTHRKAYARTQTSLLNARSHTCKPTHAASWHLGKLKIVKQVDWRSNWEEMARPGWSTRGERCGLLQFFWLN